MSKANCADTEDQQDGESRTSGKERAGVRGAASTARPHCKERRNSLALIAPYGASYGMK